MKKYVPLIAAGLVVIIAVGAASQLGHKAKPAPAKQTSTAAKPKIPTKVKNAYTLRDAPVKPKNADAEAIFSPDIAKQVTKSTNTASPPVHRTDQAFQFSFINYIGPGGYADLAVRVPITKAGVDSNHAAFEKDKPKDAQDLPEFGDKAFWDPTKHQINILKGDNEYTISAGKLGETNRSLDQSKVATKALISKF
jgi:hypothetical protein